MPWYYGDIPREDTHQMVKADGDYLIRYSGNKRCYVATTKWEGSIKHFAIQKLDEVCNLCYLQNMKSINKNAKISYWHNFLGTNALTSH